jgi:predicted small lipoprotein YifL
MIHVRMRRRAAVGLGAAVLLASVAACGGQSGPAALPSASADSATTTAPPSTAAPSVSGTSAQAAAAVQQALAAYRAAFADWTAVEAIPSKADYQNPQLADHLTGAAFSYVTGAVYVNTNVDGAVAHGKPVLLNPTVGQMVPASKPTQVLINDCVQTDAWLLYTTDGHLFNNVPGGREKTQALVTLSGGAWKVSKLVMEVVGTC